MLIRRQTRDFIFVNLAVTHRRQAMPYSFSMQIRSATSRPSLLARKPANRTEAEALANRPSFKEAALKSTVIGASLGTVTGEAIGQGAVLASGGYLGWQLGQRFGGSAITGALGAAVGSAAAFLLERKVPIGATSGAVGGFLAGGLIGGVAGCVIGGAQAIAHSNPFKKS